MNLIDSRLATFGSAVFALVLIVSPVQAKYDGTPFDSIQKMVDAGDYEQAIGELETMLSDDDQNTDVLTLLGYSYRKQAQFDTAKEYYFRALEIDPEHKAANEYLGQLYLETKELEKAQERLAVLDEACFLPCSEYTTLKQAIETYQP
ncbi:MAG: tetratricopeptide repeat protein [Pseudomonadota bacterium]